MAKNLKWSKGKSYAFYKDGRQIDIKEWNKEMNKSHSMNIIEKHPNPLIRFEEQQRRNIIISMAKQAAKRKNHVSIADVGCEEGYISQRLLNICDRLYCVDIDKNLLAIAKNRLNSRKAVYVESDAQNIKIKDNTVDVAVSSHVLEHLPNAEKGLAELARITKKDGRIILNLPNEKIVLFLKKVITTFGLGFLFGKLSTGLAPGHLHVFDKRLLRKICKDKAEIIRFRHNFPFYTNMFAELRPIKR